MTTAKLLILVATFFLTSVLSVVTGSTSLITVPVMIALGVEAHAAIATNMLALIFMSAGGSLPFTGKGVIRRQGLPVLVSLTVLGSSVGAFLVLVVPLRPLEIIIAIAMISVAALTLSSKSLGFAQGDPQIGRTRKLLGYVVTLLLAVYGGFFSGGYVTLLTAAFVVLLGMSFIESVATTKVINLCSSTVASFVFLWRGLVEVKLGLIAGGSMFLGALLGGHITLALDTMWLRRIFVAAALALALKMIWLARVGL